MTVNKPRGDIETKRAFTNYQLHLEWRIPTEHHRQGPGARQQRRVSRVTGPATAATSCRSSTRTTTRRTSTARPASIYKQYPPLVNAMRKPGEWQTYDVDLDGADVQRRRLARRRRPT